MKQILELSQTHVMSWSDVRVMQCHIVMMKKYLSPDNMIANCLKIKIYLWRNRMPLSSYE